MLFKHPQQRVGSLRQKKQQGRGQNRPAAFLWLISNKPTERYHSTPFCGFSSGDTNCTRPTETLLFPEFQPVCRPGTLEFSRCMKTHNAASELTLRWLSDPSVQSQLNYTRALVWAKKKKKTLFLHLYLRPSASGTDTWGYNCIIDAVGGSHLVDPPHHVQSCVSTSLWPHSTTNIKHIGIKRERSHHFQEFQVILKIQVCLHRHQVPRNEGFTRTLLWNQK